MAFKKYFNLLCLVYSAHAAALDSSYSLFFPKEDFLNANEDLNRANELYEAALYPKAIKAYKNFIEKLQTQKTENDSYLIDLSRFYLAQTYFSMGEYQNAMLALNENLIFSQTNSLKAEQIGYHSLYLKALSLKNLGKIELAKHAFLSYAFSNPNFPLPFHDEALFEIALTDFHEEHYEDANKILLSINSEKAKPRLNFLTQIYLARIELTKNHHAEASKILKTLDSKIEAHDPLLFELNYLLGEAAYGLQDYQNAIQFFLNALPPISPEKHHWYADSLSHLGWSYFKMGKDISDHTNKHNPYLKNAEETFIKLLAFSKNENTVLALAQCYLSQATEGMKQEYCTKAEELLSKQDLFLSNEAKAHALLLRAEAAPDYKTREQFYFQLTEEPNDTIFYAQGWHMKALNDFEYGLQLLEEPNENNLEKNAFERSAKAFETSFSLLQEKDLLQAGSALKYRALAIGYSSRPDAFSKAFQVIDQLLNHSQIWKMYPNKDEIYFLHGYFLGHAAIGSEKEKYMKIAQKSLREAAAIPNSIFGDQALSFLGTLHFQNEEYENAENAYLQLAKSYPKSPLAAEAWFWSASCADHLQKDPSIGKERRKYAYEVFPDSSFAAEAYFTFYTFPEYLQGDRLAIKHLENFTERYTDSPFLIDAHYLIGLDYKRDRKTEEGRWIRKKSLTDAIDSFQKAETLFDELLEKKTIFFEKMDYYTALRYRATLERALANLAVADDAQGAKKQIYLNYAEEVFKNLVNELHQDHLYIKKSLQDPSFPLIEEEGSFWLAQTFIKEGKDNEANRVLIGMTDKYDKLNIAKGYYLSRSLDEQGRIAMRKEENQKALNYFKKAEEAAKGNVLSADQRLDLWIQQSIAYRGLGQFDDAILILSKVVNDDAVSSLRMKAMYLRAETYELQKRPELARKQLESMVKKGGIWARKAQEKLDKDDFKYEH